MSKIDNLARCFVIFCITPLHAADGVVEINQACALNGCYAGDAPGFPVFIKEPGSYRLTGNLDLSAIPDTTAIQITASYVTLDLNGFEIKGAITCTGSGPTLECPPSGVGWAVLGETGVRGVTVRNGTVRNMGRGGIDVRGDALTVSDVRAIHNRVNGIEGESNALVTNSIAIENGFDGFHVESSSVLRGVTALGNGEDGIEINGPHAVVDGASSRGNGKRGYKASHSSKFSRSVSENNASTDTCGGGICTEKKRFYLTEATHQGDDVLGACAPGFHMANLYEIHDVAALKYDSILGRVEADMGSGPPGDVGGWIRTGMFQWDLVNCSAWTSKLEDDSGSNVRLAQAHDWTLSSGRSSSPWQGSFQPCSESIWPVWCVED